MNVQIKIIDDFDILALMRELNTSNTCKILSGDKNGNCSECCFRFERDGINCILDEVIDRLETK